MNNKRVNFIFIILLFVFIPFNTKSQETQDWVSHISYAADITQIVQADNIIYSLTDGKIFIYNTEDSSYDEYIKIDGGNTDITHIAYNQKHKCLFVTRSDANIELLYNDKSYIEIPDLKDYSAQNIDKTINALFMDEDFAYLSTNFGFLTINIKNKEVKEYGIFNTVFYSICLFENNLYAATQNGIFRTERDDNNNIQDFSNWVRLELTDNSVESEKYKFDEKSISNILVFKDKIHLLIPNKSAYILDTPNTVKKITSGGNPQSMLTTGNDHLIIINPTLYIDYESITQYTSTNINGLKYIIPNKSKSNEYWLASQGNNLSLIKKSESGIEFLQQNLYPTSGPASNYPFSQTYQNDQLIITGGGFRNNRENRPASISILKNSKWNNITSNKINQESGMNAQDFVYAISDPTNPEHIFASSWGEGLYEFENGNFKNRYDKSNSTIEELVGEDGWTTTRVSGMVYDRQQNLFLLNSMVENVIKVYQKNGQWSEIYYKELGENRYTNPKNIIIDRYNNKWITTIGTSSDTRSTYLCIFNDNGTISNTSDDKYKYIKTFVNKNNSELFVTHINSITEDSYGNIWLGTNIGPFMIENSSDIINKSTIPLNKIMIRKEGSSNSVIGLLEDIEINAIAVDGANQKWIATQNSGVYLLSSDNKEILEHFTLDDSPLPSNNIISLSIDSKGNVYFGSSRGLMALRAGVTQGNESFSDVYVYPNPVRPDYAGLISITGLKTNTNIKITDVKGNLIIEGKSLGGQYQWDGLNYRGRRVDSGIYIVFASDDNGSESAVTKIMIINE